MRELARPGARMVRDPCAGALRRAVHGAVTIWRLQKRLQKIAARTTTGEVIQIFVDVEALSLGGRRLE